MKLLVLSDAHGAADTLEAILRREADADAIFYLGDGVRDMERWQQSHPGRRLYLVRGNCDMGSPQPLEGLAAFDGLLFFYTHGHEYGVKSTLGLLAETAAARGAQVALFGHTHCPFDKTVDGVRLFNPGSVLPSPFAGAASYGILTTTPDGFVRGEHRRL